MIDAFVLKLNEKNLCSWYILPWIGLSVKSFQEANFINSFLVRGRNSIAVQVADANLCRGLFESYYYEQSFDLQNGSTVIVFYIDERWDADYAFFLEGKYSKLSEEAKDMIRQLSGLDYRAVQTDESEVSDAILMALDKDEVLKETWMHVLNIGEKSMPSDYLSPPPAHSFINLDL
jgi:hypothetical protein